MVVTGPRPYRVPCRPGGRAGVPSQTFHLHGYSRDRCGYADSDSQGLGKAPTPGDVITFRDDDHVAIVEKVDGTAVSTIEGTAPPAVGAPAASRGPLALGRPAGVDARDRAERDHQHHGAPCRPGTSSTDRLVVGAPG